MEERNESKVPDSQISIVSGYCLLSEAMLNDAMERSGIWMAVVTSWLFLWQKGNNKAGGSKIDTIKIVYWRRTPLLACFALWLCFRTTTRRKISAKCINPRGAPCPCFCFMIKGVD
jgi:hypothetical protein